MSNKERKKMEKEMNVVFTVESEEERKAKEEKKAKKAKRKLDRKIWWRRNKYDVLKAAIICVGEAVGAYMGYKTGFAIGKRSINSK